jgi:intermediate cleaving peptidase 55
VVNACRSQLTETYICWLALEKHSQGKGHTTTLFVRDRDPSRELWDGPRTGVAEAAHLFGVDDSMDVLRLGHYLKSVSASYDNIYVDIPGISSTRRRSLMERLSSAYPAKSEVDSMLKGIPPFKIKPLAPSIHRLRKIKSEAEIKLIRNAANVSGSAHSKVCVLISPSSSPRTYRGSRLFQTMRFTKPGISEAALAAHFEYLCALKGAERPAYVPVVASGSNALVIHYTANDRILNEGELILMDAGCELQSVFFFRSPQSSIG